MAKFKLAGSKKKGKSAKARGAFPCIFFMLSAMALLMLLFYAVLPKK
jgi:hypothetical protein